MKRWFLLFSSLLILLAVTACENKERNIPELLEPVGVRMDLVQAKKDTIYAIKVYEGQIVPHVEQLQFQTDGILKEINVSLGEYVTKGQTLAVLSEDDLLDQITALEDELEQINSLGAFGDRIAEADITIAKVELDKLVNWGGSYQSQALKKLEIEKLELALEHARQIRALQVEQKQKKLDALREQAGKNTLTAPCDGYVVYLDLAGIGTSVQGHKTVICITDETKRYLQTAFIADATVNGYDRVYCKIEDQEYELTYIPYDVQEYLHLSFLGEEIKSRFSVQAPEEKLKIGQTGTVIAIDNYKENVLTIPANALHGEGGDRYVYKMVNGTQIRCDVTVGVVSNTKAEITAGLQEGDLVHVKG